MATFPIFVEFLYKLAKAKPAIAARFLERADENVLHFLPAFLNGLSESGSRPEYERALARFLVECKHLVALARHFRKANAVADKSIEEVLKKAIALGDSVAVIECLVLATERGAPSSNSLLESVFVPALRHLIDQRDARWVHALWYSDASKTFFPDLSASHANLVLENLLFLPKVEYHAERILGWIAEQHLPSVWRFLGRRLNDPRDSGDLHYEATPYQFHSLGKILAHNADLAVSTVQGWFHEDSRLFQFRGGRLLRSVYPKLGEPLVQKLKEIAVSGPDTDVGFLFGVLRNFEGEPALHPVFQELVNRLAEDDPRLDEIDVALEHTGIVGGEFGRVEALRRKKEEVARWLNDPRPHVKAFALRYRQRLDQRIASEQRSAELRKEQRKRDFDSGDDM
jgi:hypothetical protein